MNVDPAILGIAMTAVTQGASAFSQYVPKLTDIRKAPPNDPTMIGDVRLGEVAAVTLTLGVGIIASALTGSHVPSIVAAIICGVMLALYESALRGDHLFEPFRTVEIIPEGWQTMPNPLMRTGTPNVGKDAPDLGILEPTPESYAGHNHPYRGTQSHGISPTDDPTNVPDWRDDRRMVPVALVPAEEHTDPLPVRIVNESPREIGRWAGGIFPVGTVPALVANRMRERTSLSISNESEQTVYLGPDSSVNKFAPVRLAPGGTFSLDNEAEVYAWSPDGLADLRVVWEYTVKGG